MLRVLSVRSLPSDRLNKVHYLKIAGRTKDTVKSRRMFARLLGVFSVRKNVPPYVFTRQSSRQDVASGRELNPGGAKRGVNKPAVNLNLACARA